MPKPQAPASLEEIITVVKDLSSKQYMYRPKDAECVCLDGWFTPKQLQAIAVLAENNVEL